MQALQAQNGLGNQSSVFNQLQNVASGQGPNPARAQLNQATGQNVAAQGALMAGQRGSSANTGLIARQAAQQGAATQQQAVGQAAAMQAQQSLGALGQLGNIANTQAAQQAAATQGYTQAAQNEQANILNAINAQNNANVGMQSNINSNNAALAGNMMNQQANFQSNLMGGAASGIMSALAEGGRVGYDDGGAVSVQDTAPQVSAPAAIAAPPASSGGGGGGGGAGIMGLLALLAEGGRVNMADGGTPAAPTGSSPSKPAAKSVLGKFFTNASQPASSSGSQPNGYYQLGTAIGTGVKNLFSSSSSNDTQSQDYYGVSGDTPIQTESEQAQGQEAADALSVPQVQQQTTTDIGDGSTAQAAKGGKIRKPKTNAQGRTMMQTTVMPYMRSAMALGGPVPALVSPGEHYIPPGDVKKVKKGKDPLEVGERIPGNPKYPGDDYRNDTVKKTLKEGGVVIPNHIMQGPNPHWEAMKFVHAVTRSRPRTRIK